MELSFLSKFCLSLQTFGIPGPAILGIISGALFGPLKGFMVANTVIIHIFPQI